MIPYVQLADLRHRISLPVLRKAAGALEGRHRSIFTGTGQDFDDLMAYRPGDDVTDIDWKASARAGQPIIRRFVRETNASVVVAVDTSVTMTAAALSEETKLDVAIDVVDVIAYLTRFRGDLLGLVYASGPQVHQLPPKAGTAHAELIRRRLRWAAENPAGPRYFGAILERLEALVRRRSLVVVIGDDFSIDERCEGILKRLRVRHDILFFSITDFDPRHGGGRSLVDVMGGEIPGYALSDERVIYEVEQMLAERRDHTRTVLQQLGIDWAAIGGSEDVVEALIALLVRHR